MHGIHFQMSQIHLSVVIISHPHTLITVDRENVKLLEHCCIVVHDKTSSLESINEVWKELFRQKNKTMDSISPTEDAFLEHCK